ncbi:MAG: endonuclease/exonuclease/phosphatase family protein [Thermoanaerobaculia bacterium]|nr:endonuclease/exonuclease/phosphatase family protein [Thermoanaerobaculia bacterium]
MVRIASYNVENLFARPKVFNTEGWAAGRPVLDAYYQVNDLMAKTVYSPADKVRMRELLLQLDIYYRNAQGAIRRRQTIYPKWAWLRKNRGTFDRQPRDASRDVEIVATGREHWIGWVALAKEPTNEVGTRLTAQVIADVDADLIGIVEAESRPSLVRFNKELLDDQYGHVMLVDGNDERGIDVGLMAKDEFSIENIRSNVDTEDDVGQVFSRDCPEYEVRTPSGQTLYLLINHFKSQSGGGGTKRQRQAKEVRRIADRLVGQGRHVVVLGDLNEGPAAAGSQAQNFFALFESASPLVDAYEQPGFDVGPRPGTFDSCGLRNRLDYMLISRSLVPAFRGGGVFRKGLWGTRQTRPDRWETYPEMTRSSEQASDHAAVFIDLDI